MLQSTRTFLLGLTLLLAACVVTPRQTDVPKERTGTGAILTESEEFEMPTGSGAMLGSGVTIERLLENGFLEIGPRESPLTLLVYTNHACHYCREFQNDLFPRLQRDFIDAGTLRMNIAILPLKKYPQSELSAAALLCSARQGKGLLVHRALTNNPTIDRKSLLLLGKTIGLDAALFQTCLDDPAAAHTLASQAATARSLTVNLVPTFFLNGEKFIGLPEYAELRGRIEAALRRN